MYRTLTFFPPRETTMVSPSTMRTTFAVVVTPVGSRGGMTVAHGVAVGAATTAGLSGVRVASRAWGVEAQPQTMATAATTADSVETHPRTDKDKGDPPPDAR
jgi:hypothetical protein